MLHCVDYAHHPVLSRKANLFYYLKGNTDCAGVLFSACFRHKCGGICTLYQCRVPKAMKLLRNKISVTLTHVGELNFFNVSNQPNSQKILATFCEKATLPFEILQ